MKIPDRILILLLLAVAITGKIIESVVFGLNEFNFVAITVDLFLVFSLFAFQSKKCVSIVLVGFSVFSLVSFISLLTGRENCGCYGVVEFPVWISLIINSLVLVVSLSCFFRVSESAVFVARFGIAIMVVVSLFQLVGFIESDVQFVDGRKLIGLNAGKVSTLLSGHDGEVLIAKSGRHKCEQAMQNITVGTGLAIVQTLGSDEVVMKASGSEHDIPSESTNVFVLPCWLEIEDGIVTHHRPLK